MTSLLALKAQMLSITRDHARWAHRSHRPGLEPDQRQCPDGSSIFCAGRVFTADELEPGVANVPDFWLTVSKQGEAFHQELDGDCLGNDRHVGGNLLRQSAFVQLNHNRHELMREVAEDTQWPIALIQEALFFATHHGLAKSQLGHEIEIIQEFAWPNERYQKRTVLTVNSLDPDSQAF